MPPILNCKMIASNHCFPSKRRTLILLHSSLHVLWSLITKYFGIHKFLSQKIKFLTYRIAGFSCEDFNLAIGLIRNIKIRKVFNYVVFNLCACTKLANRSVIYWSSSSLLQLRIHLVWHSHTFIHDMINR